MKSTVIFLVDMQSFYASVEKADRPELQNRPVIVAGDPERRSGVVLAACPLAKKKGVQNAYHLGEAQRLCPEAVVIRPRMQRYLDLSVQITDILERYTDMVEPYSIDEQFCDVTGSQGLFGDPWTMARKIHQADIIKETHIYNRVGIAPTKVLAKMACDNFAKKNRSGIFELTKENMKDYLWPLPIGKMFGVGGRLENHLTGMYIPTIGHLAKFPVHLLRKRWGINGELLWQTANGIDPSPVSPDTHSNQQKAIGHGMTLPRDYYQAREIQTVLLELCEEVCFRSRSTGVMGYTVSAGAQGADFDHPTGFHRQQTLLDATSNTIDVYHAAWDLFDQFWDREPVRRIGVALSNLCQDNVLQMSLFSDQEKKRTIGYTVDHIKRRYGATSIFHASSLTEAGQVLDRSKKIGGHYK